MELIEIIIYVLKLFSLSSFILLTLSYFFFKLKDRTRIKPYMLINTDPAAYMVPVEKEVKEPVKNKKYSSRFKVINEERIAAQYSKLENSINFSRKIEDQVKPEVRSRPNADIPNNIYSFYSPVTSEPMHKLKLSAMS